MHDPYDSFERRDAQQERSAAEWYADLWTWMRDDCEPTFAPKADVGIAALVTIARRDLGLDAA